MTTFVADGGGNPRDQAAILLFFAAIALGWVAYLRIRGRGFPRIPRPAAWLLAAAAVGSLAAGVVLPTLGGPSGVRPSTHAHLAILSPRSGQTFTGDPAMVPVRFLLKGGKIVPFTSTKLIPNTGHLHIYLDGALIQMTTSLHGRVGMLPGKHTLNVEFVAVDHLPFNPRVRASVSFRVVP